jgi:hypothetical protein
MPSGGLPRVPFGTRNNNKKEHTMGLDMYAFTQPAAPDSEVDFTACDASELHYWRKHPNLHGWMEALYITKGGAESFNCVNLVLTADDLNRLEQAVLHNTLPNTEGFFFGESDGSEQADDLLFIAKARAAIAANLTVAYSSWW